MGQYEIHNFLKANKGTWFTIRQLANILDMDKTHFSRCMSKMKKVPDIFDGIEEKFQKEKRVNGHYAIKYYRFLGNVYKP